ncbi:phosphotransferase family protein [Streptosporangium jomthongense]|uniref:Phosphotransferase family protein n=1 Tax=Streptosporangium jomthongense TaxID=1193683 RepID=A0ABV8EYZ8_9ACTN
MTTGNDGLPAWPLPDAPEDLVVHEGQFHRVIVGADRVVCLPRTRAAASRLPRRVEVLRLLAELDLGFATPSPLFEHGTRYTDGRSAPGGDAGDALLGHGTGDVDGWPFLVLSRVPGAPLEVDTLKDPAVAEAVAARYVTLLASLAGAGSDERARAALTAPRDRWRCFAQDVRSELFGLMSQDGRRRADRELVALDDLPHLTDALVHGDLGVENVLWEIVDGRPRLGGVVDWDEVTIGDQAEDLAAIGAGHGGAFLRRVFALGGWSGDTAARVTVIGRTFALQQALSAFRDEDEEELADGLSAYR